MRRILQIGLWATVTVLMLALSFIFLKRSKPIMEAVMTRSEPAASENVREDNRNDSVALSEEPNLRTAIEERMERKFSDEEIVLKPTHIPWHAWGFSIETHENSVKKNGVVRFYGQVVSEAKEPIENVTINASISWAEPSFVTAFTTGEGTRKRQVPLITDAYGRFRIEGLVGQSLIISDFKKEGYEVVGEKRFKGTAAKKSWGYSFVPGSATGHVGEPNSPVTFIMKRK